MSEARMPELMGVATQCATQTPNELALPFLLPDELMAHVFSFLVVLDPPKLNASVCQGNSSKLGWISVSHVCQRWRTAALGWPELWGRLSLDDNQLWDVFLQRAKESPLFINFTTWTVHTPARIPFILDHQDRLRELCLHGVPPDQLQLISTALVGPLSQLRTLTLQGSQATGILVAKLHPNFLSDIAPALEELTLEGIAFPWGSGSPTLTKLVNILPDMLQLQSSHTLADVAHTLHQLPALETLTLSGMLPESRSNFPNTNPISLPHLQVLRLTDKTDSCWHLWSWLSAPALKDLYINCTTRKDCDSLIYDLLRAHLKALPTMFNAAQIGIPSRYSQELTLRLDSALWLPKSGHDYCEPGREDYKILLKILNTRPVDLARQLLITVDDITHLAIEDSFADDRLFYEVFLPLREVIHLELNGADTGVGLSALIPRTRSEEDLLFPSFEILTCTNIDFERRLQHRGEPTSGHFALDHTIKGRAHMGIDSLNEINFTACNIQEKWVERWRKVVDDVFWDEEERDSEGPENSGSMFCFVSGDEDEDDEDEDENA